MTAKEIRSEVRRLVEEINAHQRGIETAKLQLGHIRAQCPHRSRESWTNNDGDGQFTVERCNVCGLQKDGGLG